MITISDLALQYSGTFLFQHVDLQFTAGNCYGVIGANGAGKSTTMNIITGCLSATSGRVRIDGHDIFEEPGAAKRLIGYLPEQPPLYLNETPVEYLRFVGEAKGLRGGALERQIAEVVEQTRLTGVRHRCISALSKGYRQRVGIAQALLGSPRVIILDEPTVGLDPLQIIEIRELIRQLGQTHTVLFSSHILSEVSAICDQILIISKGSLAACDTPEGLTRLMTGEEELEITVKGTPEELQSVLDGLEEIEGSSLEKISETQTKAVIKTGENCDIREKLFYLLADARLPLMDMHVTAKSLEDIFLDLTGRKVSL